MIAETAASSVQTTRAERRRVVAATTIGTAIEWYDFFLYASVAGLVFNQLMFGPLGPGAATIVSFLTVGLSFLFRPLGAFLAGHYADRLGRRVVLMVTLFTMGGATALIGLLPTYDSIGIWAPIMLILFRILQGISAGGEWGSAVLLAVEHAPDNKRGLFGAGPQVGVPAGLLLASGALAIMNVLAPGDAFMEWGWRIPFLFSILLVLVGFYIRRGVDESPVFEEIAARKETAPSSPVGTLFRRHLPLVITGALVFAGNGTVGYMTTGGYIQNYATNPDGLALERGPILLAVTCSAASWMLFTLLAGFVSDYLGRRNTYIIGFLIQAIGAAALFPLVNTGNLGIITGALIFLTAGLGFTYGQQSAMYAELFPASIRGSGVSITYAIGSILGGAFAPTIAAALVEATGGTTAVSVYLVGATMVGLIAILLLKDRSGIPLGPDHEEEQSTGHFMLSK
ncbi:Inner membrane metabolite transport protein YhjE [Corynebacterium occultum]|uniref:Inner membrane metabolite transport protein YhjE n=1 Tax=Corynebacterium occultum TaxID=2675219 RepID=A0A6B8W0D4_9CORY|nr:MFS transporter [Corynebacterium occultum]QGU08679.1 Inner membrane metabolite transport protein YhjE [Corynebacterium occultum]